MSEARRNSESHSRPFIGAKVRGIIPVRSAWSQDLLVQLSLDPKVNSIAHLPSAQFRGAPVFIDAIVLERDGVRVALDVPEDRDPRDVDDHGLVLLSLGEQDIQVESVTTEQIKRDPLFSNARNVWRYRRRSVPFVLRQRILNALTYEGSMKLSELLRYVPNEEESAEAILSLACADVIELDLKCTVLGPETMVGVRKRSDER